jgi:hypothetical protein
VQAVAEPLGIADDAASESSTELVSGVRLAAAIRTVDPQEHDQNP